MIEIRKADASEAPVIAAFQLAMALETENLVLDGYAATIEALTADDLLAAAQKYFKPGAYALAVAGPELNGK